MLLQADMSAEPKVADDGTVWTPGAVDFFRIVNTQVTLPCLVYGTPETGQNVKDGFMVCVYASQLAWSC